MLILSVAASLIAIGVPGPAVSADEIRASDHSRRFAQIVAPSRHGGSVCFYKAPDFSGLRWCHRPGSKVVAISSAGWDDAISSIRVSRGGVVHVCKEPGLAGDCTIYTRDQRRLGAFDNAISSFVVFPG